MKTDDLHRRLAKYAFASCLMTIVALFMPIDNASQSRGDASSSQMETNDTEIACRLLPTLNLVLVEVEVKDRNRRPVLNLEHKDFVVNEDGKEQQIQLCSKEKVLGMDTFPQEYIIGYFPPGQNQGGQFRRIQISVRKAKQQGLRVRYFPKGYAAKDN